MNLYYINISPFVFSDLNRKEERAIGIVFEKFKNLKNLFLVIDEERWFKIFFDFIEYLDEDLKKNLEEYLNLLDKKNKIIKDECNYEKENEILNCFDFVEHYVASQSNPERILLPSEFKYKDFEDSFIASKMKKEQIDKFLQKILMFSEKLEIIDPYFIPYYKKDIIRMIETHMSNRLNKKGKIYIHTRFNEKFHKNNRNTWEKIKSNFKHNIEIYFWDDSNSSNKMHDRYLVTEHCVVSIGKGLETHSKKYWTTVSWSFYPWDESDKILKNYRENSTDFELKDKV